MCECKKGMSRIELVNSYKVGTALWTGDKCQYQDISPQFQIIFWVTVGLVVLLLWVVSLLASAGNSSGRDGQAIPGRAKTE